MLLVLATACWSAAAGATDMDWWTVDGGGGRCAGDGLALTVTAGQPDAGRPATGAGFTWSGGFWTGSSTPPEPPLFADDFESGDLSAWSSSSGGSVARPVSRRADGE